MTELSTNNGLTFWYKNLIGLFQKKKNKGVEDMKFPGVK